MDPILGLALPAGAVAFALVCYGFHKVSVWSFDRKHPGLSRNGMRAVAEDRAARAQTPLPPALRPWSAPRSANGPEGVSFDMKRRRFVPAGEEGDEAAVSESRGETAV